MRNISELMQAPLACPTVTLNFFSSLLITSASRDLVQTQNLSVIYRGEMNQ